MQLVARRHAMRPASKLAVLDCRGAWRFPVLAVAYAPSCPPGCGTEQGRRTLTAMPLWKAPDDTDLRNLEDLKMIAWFVLPPLGLIAIIIALLLILVPRLL